MSDEYIVVTTKDGDFDAIETINKRAEAALKDHGNKDTIYSRIYQSDIAASDILTPRKMRYLADIPQDSLAKIMEINRIALIYANKDDIVGMVMNAIRTNLNTEYRLSFPNFDGKRNKGRTITRAEKIIEQFNEDIDIRGLIRKAIPGTYLNGNYLAYLRRNGKNYVVDEYPLGIGILAPFLQDSQPIIMVDVNALNTRLLHFFPMYYGKQDLFFDKLDNEIKMNYPPEVYRAFRAKENVAILDFDHSGVIRINDYGHTYGLTPIFRAFESLMMLDNFGKADNATAKIRAKKIIVQLMREELLGDNGLRRGWEDAAYAHDELVRAVKQEVALYTGIPGVEDVKFVESTGSLTDIDTVNHYRSKALSTLGIGFMSSGDTAQSLSTANIALKQLLRTINSISEQLETIIEKWYKVVLKDNNISEEYAPKIRIIDSEQLEMDIRLELSKTLLTTYGASYKTAFDMIGIDVEDEMRRKTAENEAGYDAIFIPKQTSYTMTKGKENIGRPSDDDNNDTVDKREYDEQYNDIGRV